MAARSTGQESGHLAGPSRHRQDERRARPREGDGLERRRDERLGQPERGGDSEGRDARGRPADLQRFRRIPPSGPRRPQADRPRRGRQRVRPGGRRRDRRDCRDDPDQRAANRPDRERLLRAHPTIVLPEAISKTIKFQPIHDDAMKNILRTIATEEGVEVASEVLDVIVEPSSGDLRSAINDLESLAISKDTVRGTGTKALGYRDRERTIFPAIE